MNLTPNRKKETQKHAGFTLIELLVVVVLVMILAAIVVPRGFFGSHSSHGGEQLMNDIYERLYERRKAVQRLNSGSQLSSFQTAPAPPLEFNFEDLSTTASIVTEGVDNNHDGYDDETGDKLTFLRTGAGNSMQWDIAYRGDAIKIPADWKLARTPSELGAIPLIAGGIKGRGVLVTRIGFDGTGRAFHRNQSGVWEKQPPASAATKASYENAFWAIYFVRPGTANTALAIAVYPSGNSERFYYDGTQWRGYSDRLPKKT